MLATPKIWPQTQELRCIPLRHSPIVFGVFQRCAEHLVGPPATLKHVIEDLYYNKKHLAGMILWTQCPSYLRHWSDILGRAALGL